MYAPLVERTRLTKLGSDKETYHVSFDLKNTGITYAVGDCLAIYPENDPLLVEEILRHFPGKAESLVTNDCTLRSYLTSYANLAKAPLLPTSLSAVEFCASLRPLLPRFYSIASSMRHVGERADLLITLVGTCSDFLCHRAEIGTQIPLYHHPSKNFFLPPEAYDQPLLMIGPGTGVAPFRGFMQERISSQSPGENWLFFGERRKATDFYYEEEWESYKKLGKLHLDTAFSRDGKEKFYVQHRMLEKQKQVADWLEKGAYLFLCGDAKQMAKDVEATLSQIIHTQLNVDPKGYIKNLKEKNRYQKDVY